MTNTDTNKPFHVNIDEYERGWGSKTDERIGFDTQKQAETYIKNYNAKNTLSTAPDWYMVAKPHNF